MSIPLEIQQQQTIRNLEDEIRSLNVQLARAQSELLTAQLAMMDARVELASIQPSADDCIEPITAEHIRKAFRALGGK